MQRVSYANGIFHLRISVFCQKFKETEAAFYARRTWQKQCRERATVGIKGKGGIRHNLTKLQGTGGRSSSAVKVK